MFTDIIEVGNKIDITNIISEKPGSAKGEKSISDSRVIYKSQVYDIDDDDELKIAMPFDGPKIVVLPLNSRYNMCFYTRTGLFQCVGHIVDRYKSKNQLVLVVALKTGLQKVQRREFFRLEKMIDIKYRPLTEAESQMESVRDIIVHEQAEGTDNTYIEGIAVDLGGGGARFVSSQFYDISSYIIMKFKITVNNKIIKLQVIGRIILSDKLPNKSGQFENRIEFVRIQDQEREKLIQYIFEEERKMRQKEKS